MRIVCFSWSICGQGVSIRISVRNPNNRGSHGRQCGRSVSEGKGMIASRSVLSKPESSWVQRREIERRMVAHSVTPTDYGLNVH